MVRVISCVIVIVFSVLGSSANAQSEEFSILEEVSLHVPTLQLTPLLQLGIPNTEHNFRNPQSGSVDDELARVEEVSPPFLFRGQGSANELRGRVCVEHIFVDDSESSWTEPLRTESLRASSSAFRQLSKMATQKGFALSFQEIHTVFQTEGKIPLASISHSVLRENLVGLDEVKSYSQIVRCPDVDCDQRMRIVYLAKTGRSFALAQDIGSTSWQEGEVESVVMYLRHRQVGYYYDPGVEIAAIDEVDRPGVFVHEVLHVFGAEDLYTPIARKEIAQANYSADIMLENDRFLQTMKIEVYTAYLIGWSEQVPPELP